MDRPISYICITLTLVTFAKPLPAQPFCPGPYCGAPTIGPYDPRGYKRGPMGDFIDRCFYCQGPMQLQRRQPGPYLYDRQDRQYFYMPGFPPRRLY